MVCIGVVGVEPRAVDGIDSKVLGRRLSFDREAKIFVHDDGLQVLRLLLESLELVGVDYDVCEGPCLLGWLPGLEVQPVHDIVDAANVALLDRHSEDLVSIVGDSVRLNSGS